MIDVIFITPDLKTLEQTIDTNNMKIAVLDCHDEYYEAIARLCLPSRRKYCALKGYDFIEYKFDKRPPYSSCLIPNTWGRIFGVMESLEKHEWIMYMDTDIVITNMGFSLESIADDRFNLILGRAPRFDTRVEGHLSAANIMFRNDPWTFEFLKMWSEQTQFVREPYHAKPEHKHLATLGYGGLFFDQSALHFLYDKHPEVRKRTKIVGGINDKESTFNEKSFLIHFTRKNKEERIKSFLRGRLLL